MIKTIVKVVGIVAITYATVASCTVMSVVVLDHSLKNTKSSELFPN